MNTASSILTVLLVVALIGCSDTLPIESFNADSHLSDAEAATALSKAERTEYSFTYDLADEDPFIECRGELMKFHGILTINIREVTTPSGNLLVRGRVDYPDDHWAEGIDTGIVWTLRKGLNPYTETLKGDFYSEDDFWVQNWTIHEWYTNPDHGNLQIRWWGGLKFDKDGNFTLYRDRITCK